MKVFLSGPIGIGKSTVVVRTVALLDGMTVAGLRTRPLVREGKRTGYVLESLSGEQQVFADLTFPQTIRFGRFGVRPDVFSDLGVRALEEARPADLVVVDELGVMETAATPYVRAVECLMSGPARVLAVVQERALGFWEPTLLAAGNSRHLQVSATNRDELPQQIARLLRAG